MKLMISLFFTFLLSSAIAAPLVDIPARDVFVPPVLTPNADCIWKIGTTQTVTWDVSHPPERITNTKATIILVKDKLLDIDNPLLTDIDVLDGQADVVVPNVKPGEYQILVFGDSGNTGAPFTIVE